MFGDGSGIWTKQVMKNETDRKDETEEEKKRMWFKYKVGVALLFKF